jgi:hypothetical protein
VSPAEDGPIADKDFQFLQGEMVFVRMRFAGFTKAKDDEDRERIHLSWKVEAIDPQGVPLVEPKTGDIAAQLTQQDKDWMPKARHDFLLPPLLDPGNYKVIISGTDVIGKTSARQELVFRVRGRIVEPSDTLIVRNFRFLRSEEDAVGLSTPAYRAGDPVWARFDITGYRFGERNRYEVGYGLEVFDASGKSIYAQPEAAQESRESFYRRRYMPGMLSLNPSKDIAKGEYTIVLRLRDVTGGQQQESRHAFTIE